MFIALDASVTIEASVPAPRRTAERDDRRLAKRLRRRDPDALREVYDEFGGAVFGFLVQMLDDRATAEDVQQQVFLEVWQHSERYDPRRASLRTWILVIARSRAIDHLRRRIPEPRDPIGGIALFEQSDEAFDELLEHWRMAHLLRTLPDDEADLLRRRFYEDRTQVEIAAETGIPLGTVKSRMASGLRRLAIELEAEVR